jgi:hypothetical protein
MPRMSDELWVIAQSISIREIRVIRG